MRATLWVVQTAGAWAQQMETQKEDSTKMAAVTARDSAHMKRMKMKDITKEEARATRWEERKVDATAAAKRAQ